MVINMLNGDNRYKTYESPAFIRLTEMDGDSVVSETCIPIMGIEMNPSAFIDLAIRIQSIVQDLEMTSRPA